MGVLRKSRLAIPLLATVALVAAGLAASASSGTRGGSGHNGVKAKKTYSIVLSNNFLGGGWRNQMIKTTEFLAQRPPLKGRVKLRVVNADSTVSAHIASLNNIIQTKPDAIVVDASSPTALNATLRRACQQGILVLSFDQVVTEKCAWKFSTDWAKSSRATATWLAEALHGKGTIFMDNGLAGVPISIDLSNGFKAALKKYPGIKVACTFYGKYTLAEEQAGAASCLAGNPQVDGLLVQGYGAGALKAIMDAGHEAVPFTGGAYNVAASTCANLKAKCWFMTNPAWMAALAIQQAVDVLDGKKPNKPGTVLLNAGWLTSLPIKGLPGPQIKIQVGKNVFPNLSGDLFLPISPPWAKIPPQAVSGK